MKDIMHYVQDLSVLYNNVVHKVICEGWHLTYMWGTLEWSHHFMKRGGLGP